MVVLPGDVLRRAGDGPLEIATRLLASPSTSTSSGSTSGPKKSRILADDCPRVLLRNRAFLPKIGDAVLGVVTKRLGADYARVCIGAGLPALLPTLAFNAATKRNRPSLEAGDYVYCWVSEIRGAGTGCSAGAGALSSASEATKQSSSTTSGAAAEREPSETDLLAASDIVLSCVDAASPQAWSTGESYYGVLKPGGYMLKWDVRAENARAVRAKKLRAAAQGDEDQDEAGPDGAEKADSAAVGSDAQERRTKNHLQAVLNKLAKAVMFESAVGANDRVYVRAPAVRDTLLLGHLLDRVSDPSLSDAMVEVLVTRFRDEHGSVATKRRKLR